MEIVQIAKEIWKNLDLYIKRDRTPGAFEFHPSNPGILRMVKKTFYKPNIREFTSVSNVSMRESGGGQFIPGKTFEDSSVARFCQYFLDRNEEELVTKFKDTFREITHPYYSNELQDEIAVSVLVYRYTEGILSALLKDEKTRWSKKDEEFLLKLLDNDVKLRAYSGLTNIQPNTFDDKSRANLDLELRYENRGVRTVIRRPQSSDFPKDFMVGELEGDNEIPSNISKPSLSPTYLYIYSERDSSTIPIRFHHQTESLVFGRIPAFYSQLDAFEKAFQLLYWERLDCLRFFRLIQSQTVPDHSFLGYSVFLGEEKIYDNFILKKPNSESHRYFEWNLKTAEKRKAAESFLNLIFKKDIFHRLIEKEDTEEDVEQRLRGIYERYNEIIDSNHDYLENINDSIVALEKFYSERKDQSKEETLRGLANLVRFLFNDSKYIYIIFDVSYCLRNKYSHHEVRDGDIRECVSKMVKDEDEEDKPDHSFYLNYLQNSLVDLLRFTIIVSFVSDMNSEDFSKAMRTGRSLKEALPKSISKVFHGEHYADNFLRFVIDSNSRR